jgi:hypothetical protein
LGFVKFSIHMFIINQNILFVYFVRNKQNIQIYKLAQRL